MVTLSDIQAARQRIRHYVRHTPVITTANSLTAAPEKLHLKLENLQVAGSFKSRGAFNTLLQLDDAAKARGVVAASGGNHGVALAYAAKQLGISATIFLPESVLEDRVNRIGVWGAQVIQAGSAWDDAHTAGLAYAAEHGMTYVHPFDAKATIAGQGTVGLELLEDVPEMDIVLVAIGGGGLMAGVGLAIKSLKPDVRVIGIEPVGAASMKAAVSTGHVVTLPQVRTIADTLSPRAVSDLTLSLTRQHADELVLVEDIAMVDAMRWLWRESNQLVEPAGAAVIAALQTGAVDISGFKHPVALICGGNAAAGCVFENYESAALNAPAR